MGRARAASPAVRAAGCGGRRAGRPVRRGLEAGQRRSARRGGKREWRRGAVVALSICGCGCSEALHLSCSTALPRWPGFPSLRVAVSVVNIPGYSPSPENSRLLPCLRSLCLLFYWSPVRAGGVVLWAAAAVATERRVGGRGRIGCGRLLRWNPASAASEVLAAAAESAVAGYFAGAPRFDSGAGHSSRKSTVTSKLAARSARLSCRNSRRAASSSARASEYATSGSSTMSRSSL